jgi:hypothetical protein
VNVRQGLVVRRKARVAEHERLHDVVAELPLVRFAADALREQGEHDEVGIRVRELRAGRKQQRLGSREPDELLRRPGEAELASQVGGHEPRVVREVVEAARVREQLSNRDPFAVRQQARQVQRQGLGDRRLGGRLLLQGAQRLPVPPGDALTGERAVEGGLDQAVELLEPVADRPAIPPHRSLLVGPQARDPAGYPPRWRPVLIAPPGRTTVAQPEAVQPLRAVAEGQLLRMGGGRMERAAVRSAFRAHTCRLVPPGSGRT